MNVRFCSFKSLCVVHLLLVQFGGGLKIEMARSDVEPLIPNVWKQLLLEHFEEFFTRLLVLLCLVDFHDEFSQLCRLEYFTNIVEKKKFHLLALVYEDLFINGMTWVMVYNEVKFKWLHFNN